MRSLRQMSNLGFTAVLLALFVGGCGGDQQSPDQNELTLNQLTAKQVAHRLTLEYGGFTFEPTMLQFDVAKVEEQIGTHQSTLKGGSSDGSQPSDPYPMPPSNCPGGLAHGVWKQLDNQVGVYFGTMRDQNLQQIGLLGGIYGFGKLYGIVVSSQGKPLYLVSGTLGASTFTANLHDAKHQSVGILSGSYTSNGLFFGTWARNCPNPCKIKCPPGTQIDPNGRCACVPVECRPGTCPPGMVCDMCPSVCKDQDPNIACPAVCGPPVCVPAPPPPPPCMTKHLKGKCQSEAAWKKLGEQTCRKQGLTLKSISMGMPCAIAHDGNGQDPSQPGIPMPPPPPPFDLYGEAKVTCCKLVPPPPPPPPPPSCVTSRLQGKCQSEAAWKKLGEQTCRKQGLMLRNVKVGTPCATTADDGQPGGQPGAEPSNPGDKTPGGAPIPMPPPNVLYGDATVTCCKLVPPPPPPPPPPSCVTTTIGATGQCMSADELKKEAVAVCKKRQMVLKDISFGQQCPSIPEIKAFTEAKVTCCADVPPPPPSCKAERLAGKCQTPDDWRKEAEVVCRKQGLTLRNFKPVQQCPTKAPEPFQIFSGATFECCKTTTVDCDKLDEKRCQAEPTCQWLIGPCPMMPCTPGQKCPPVECPGRCVASLPPNPTPTPTPHPTPAP
jgi:hypothetical protein